MRASGDQPKGAMVGDLRGLIASLWGRFESRASAQARNRPEDPRGACTWGRRVAPIALKQDCRPAGLCEGPRPYRAWHVVFLSAGKGAAPFQILETQQPCRSPAVRQARGVPSRGRLIQAGARARL